MENIYLTCTDGCLSETEYRTDAVMTEMQENPAAVCITAQFRDCFFVMHISTFVVDVEL